MILPIVRGVKEDQLLIQHHILEVLKHLGRQLAGVVHGLELPQTSLMQSLFQWDSCPLIKNPLGNKKFTLGQVSNPISHVIKVQPLLVWKVIIPGLNAANKVQDHIPIWVIMANCNGGIVAHKRHVHSHKVGVAGRG
jgi:hypothetical protein